MMPTWLIIFICVLGTFTLGLVASLFFIGGSDDPEDKGDGIIKKIAESGDDRKTISRKRKFNTRIRILCCILWPLSITLVFLIVLIGLVYMLISYIFSAFSSDEEDGKEKSDGSRDIKIEFKTISRDGKNGN